MFIVLWYLVQMNIGFKVFLDIVLIYLVIVVTLGYLHAFLTIGTDILYNNESIRSNDHCLTEN